MRPKIRALPVIGQGQGSDLVVGQARYVLACINDLAGARLRRAADRHHQVDLPAPNRTDERDDISPPATWSETPFSASTAP